MDPDLELELAVAAAKAKKAKASVASAPPSPEMAAGLAELSGMTQSPQVQEQSWGEAIGNTAWDMAAAGVAGIARGGAALVGLPGTVGNAMNNGMTWVGKKAGLIPEDWVSPQSPISGEGFTRVMGDMTGGATDYRGETTAGKYAGTVGEFIPGALGGGIRGLLQYGVAPGMASEAAGQATEGTKLEPYARIAAALLTPLAMAKASPNIRPLGADPERVKLAETLQAQGVTPTVGQVTGWPTLQRMEGTVAPLDGQIDDMTIAAMRSIGSKAKKATPEALADAQSTIVQKMDDVLDGVSFTPTAPLAQEADDVVKRYLEEAPSASVVPRVRAIADEIMDSATNPGSKAIDLSTLRTWRSALGRMTSSADEATRNAAVGLRKVIDDATDAALSAAGRTDDIAKLAKAREEYRNFLAVRDASTRAGAEAGLLSPTALNQAVIRTQGREAYAVGAGTDLAETSRAGAAMLRPQAAVDAGAVRRMAGAAQIGGGGGGAAIGAALGFGLPGAIVGGTLGALAPPVAQAAMRSKVVQALMMDPKYQSGNAARTIAGILAGFN